MAMSDIKPPFQRDVFLRFLGERSIVLVGMMGVGKSSVGRRLAKVLELPFVDADKEIERAADRSIVEIFEAYGEAHFREGEKKVIQRLLGEGPQVLATGGGAYMNDETREQINAVGVSIWLKADLDVLMQRVQRKPTRPLLKKPNPEQTMRELIAVRDPVYAQAQITVVSRDGPHENVVVDILEELQMAMENPSSFASGNPLEGPAL